MSLRAQPPAGLRWLEGTSPVLETWPRLQSEPGGTDPCSVVARRGPPWPRALEASASSRCRQAPALPLPAPRPPTRAHTHSAPTFSPSPASPVPLTPLDNVCLSCQTQGLCGEGMMSPLRSAPGSQCHVGTVICRQGPQQPPCCRNVLGAQTGSCRSLRVTSLCGSPRALLLSSRSPALEAPTWALGGPCWSRSYTFS